MVVTAGYRRVAGETCPRTHAPQNPTVEASSVARCAVEPVQYLRILRE